MVYKVEVAPARWSAVLGQGQHAHSALAVGSSGAARRTPELSLCILHDAPQAQEARRCHAHVHVPECGAQAEPSLCCGLPRGGATKSVHQVRMVGWKIAGIHVLRCLKDGDTLGKLDYHFFYRCCSASLKQTEKRDRHKKQPSYPDEHKTFLLYWAECDKVPSHNSPSLKSCAAMITAMATQMETNTMNMLALHFHRRLHQYIRFRYAKEGKTQLPYKATKRLVDSCYRVQQAPVLDDDGNPTGKAKLAWSAWDEPKTTEERELREWLGEVPWKWAIRKNAAHFLTKVYDMLSWMEKFVETHPKTKGSRLYTLLPCTTSFVPGHITINVTSLFQIFSRMHRNPEVKRFVVEELNEPWGSENGSSWTQHRDVIFRKLFKLDGLESATRKFAYQITTNGYSASVLLRREVPTPVHPALPLKSKKRETNTGSPVDASQPPAKDAFGIALCKLPVGYTPDKLIGIDPGVRTLCTAACVGYLPVQPHRNRRRNRRRKRNRKGRHKRRRKRKSRNHHDQSIVEISTGAYYHLGKLDDQRAWNNRLKKRATTYADLLEGMPSFKTTSYDLYVHNLHYFLESAGYLLQFSAQHGFRKWRFLTYGLKQKAMSVIAKQLVPTASPQVCIGLGDWSCQDGLWGNPKDPVKAFRKALERRATVLPMDEFRTSKLCSCCHERLHPARLETKVKDRDTTKIKIVKKKNRNVLHCLNSCCKAHFWNRVVNAAINILDVAGSHSTLHRGSVLRSIQTPSEQGVHSPWPKGTLNQD